MNEQATSPPSVLQSPALWFFLLWLSGPLSWAVATATYRYGTESTWEWWIILGGLLGQPAFALVWCLFVIANPRLFRSSPFWLLSLHLLCLVAFLVLPQLRDGVARTWFEGILFGQWALTVVTGVVCLWQLLHPAAAVGRTPPR